MASAKRSKLDPVDRATCRTWWSAGSASTFASYSSWSATAGPRSAPASWERLLGFTDAQVRKDLAYFGHFGHPGIGYRCDELIGEIRRILGTDRQWTVTMVGVGNLGRALLRYRGFAAQGFRIVAAFDADPRVVGMKIEGIPVYSQQRLAEVVRQLRIQLGMITVPGPQAQQVADQLVSAGIEGIVNFAPVTLSLPAEVSLVGVDLTTELEQLAFSVANRIGTR